MKNLLVPFARPVRSAPRSLSVIAALMAGLWNPAFAASNIVISQIYGGGGNSGSTYTNDYIELFNRSGTAVDLSNWSVQYASAAGSSWTVTPLPAVVLQPGQYLLVQQAKGSGGSTALPAADASGSIAMSATAGKVVLSNSADALAGASPSGSSVIEIVGFGGTASAYEAAAAPAPSNTLAILRADNGCSDSDNNSADFTTGAPTPRNTSSALNVCGAPVAPPVVATCPASLTLALGIAGSASLSATDADGIVNAAAITSSAVPGISLGSFTPASAAGGSASVNLDIAANVAAGTYPVVVNFSNDQAQATSCTIAISVQGLAAITHTIPQIQGAGASSPYAETVQTTEGVVTLKVGTGFFIQDAAGDGDPTTSDGLFVYTGSTASTVTVGQKVRVTGTVSEYTSSGATRSYTELGSVTAVIAQGSGSVSPTNIGLPNANLAQYEGMLVRFASPLTVSQTSYVGSRGELTLSSGRLELPTNRYSAGSAEALALAAANAANMIVLDDGISVTPTVIPYIGEDGTVRAGDTISDLTGVVDYGSAGGGGASFKLQPSVAPVFSRDNPRTAAPEVAAGNVKVASANVLNFFTTFTNGEDAFGQTGQGCTLGASTSKSNCRGADNSAEFIRQRDKIVLALKAMDADAVGLMEIQNNGETAVSYLVDQLNAAIGSVTYAYVPKPPATGTDAIRVAMIYKPAKLTPVGSALSDSDDINNRPPMAQTFRTASGEKFSLVVNHLKSKGSCPSGSGTDADQGDSQGCWNATRILQAKRLVGTFVPQVVAAAGDPDVLLIGDMNSYGHEDPINAMTDAGFVNQLERYVRPQGIPYSYVFDGVSGYLDHALASAALSPQVSGVTEWHINADEPTVIDYNTDGKPQDLYTATPYRASDHDPVVISLNLQPQAADVTASLARSSSALVYNRVTQLYSATFTIKNTGNATLAGPFQLEFDGLPAGVTLLNASGSHAGSPYVTATAAQLAPGASAAVTLSFSNPSKASITYTTKIYSGNF
jgi:predicted extracellular nuclease